MAQKVKLSTIADALKVSTATVSLALRDSPLVAETTREKIKEQATLLGYIYNRRAASLRTSKSGIVGVVVHDIMNPFYAEILKSIETELDKTRQTFILSNHYDSTEKQREVLARHLAALRGAVPFCAEGNFSRRLLRLRCCRRGRFRPAERHFRHRWR